ncbi:class I SAM-dependent methyltransferase [Lutibacter sp. B2]|nr:class I SAM-dependent methyltransferase [Lutibacter sp. B2]
MNLNMKKKWETLHSQSRFRPKYPAEIVVQFIFRNFKRDGKIKVLDLGCGTGRHVYFMANENIDAYGVDISESGINYTKKLLQENGLQDNLKVSSVDQLPFDNNYFDGLISYGVLYYCKNEEIKKAVDEIYRVLKPTGKGLLFVRNEKDYRYGDGEEIEKNTFMIKEDDESKCAFNENGMIMHFFEKEELVKLFSKFSSVQIDEIIETHENGQYCDANFVVDFTK